MSTKTQTTATNTAEVNENVTEVKTTKVTLLQMSVGEYIDSKCRNSESQRSIVATANFIDGIGEMLLKNGCYLPPITVFKDGDSFIIVDGQQRTHAIKIIVASLSHKFDKAQTETEKALYSEKLDKVLSQTVNLVVITELGDDINEAQLFKALNTTNAPTKIQATKGTYSNDIKAIYNTITDVEVTDKEKGITYNLHDSIIGKNGIATKFDDIVAGLTKATISNQQFSTNFTIVNKELAEVTAIDGDKLTRYREEAKTATANLIKLVNLVSDKQKVQIAKPKYMVPLYRAMYTIGKTLNINTMLDTINSIIDEDGKRLSIAGFSYKLNGATKKANGDIFELSSNAQAATVDRAEWFIHTYNKLTAGSTPKQKKPTADEIEALKADLIGG